MAISKKISTAFFYRNRKADPEIHMESQEAQNTKNNLEKEKGKIGRLRLPNFKTNYKATLVNKV